MWVVSHWERVRRVGAPLRRSGLLTFSLHQLLHNPKLGVLACEEIVECLLERLRGGEFGEKRILPLRVSSSQRPRVGPIAVDGQR